MFAKSVENTARHKQFLLFIPVLSKDFDCRHLKTRACFGWVKGGEREKPIEREGERELTNSY